MMTLCNFERKTRENLLLAYLLKKSRYVDQKDIPLVKVIIDWVDTENKLLNKVNNLSFSLRVCPRSDVWP